MPNWKSSYAFSKMKIRYALIVVLVRTYDTLHIQYCRCCCCSHFTLVKNLESVVTQRCWRKILQLANYISIQYHEVGVRQYMHVRMLVIFEFEKEDSYQVYRRALNSNAAKQRATKSAEAARRIGWGAAGGLGRDSS